MTRFHGEVGFGSTQEIEDGVWDDLMTERSYFGDVERNTLRLEDGTSVNSNLSLSNTVSIVADAYATEHVHDIRYVRWSGALWTVSTAEIKSPRVLLRLGEVYNGPTPGTTGSP